MEKYYLIVYSFMRMELGLKGVVRDVFAAIFGFWLKAGEVPVYAPFASLSKITGASRPAISSAIAKLEEKGNITIKKSPGKRSMYDVHLTESMLRDFEVTFGRLTGAKSNGAKNSTRSIDVFYSKKEKNGQYTPLSVGDVCAFDKSDKL